MDFPHSLVAHIILVEEKQNFQVNMDLSYAVVTLVSVGLNFTLSRHRIKEEIFAYQ